MGSNAMASYSNHTILLYLTLNNRTYHTLHSLSNVRKQYTSYHITAWSSPVPGAARGVMADPWPGARPLLTGRPYSTTP